MSFLTPLFLLGGLAIAGPIMYHLIRRTTREKTMFSSLMFLLPSPPRISKRHRVEHIFLLLLRILALLLLALGFSRPFFKETQITDPTVTQPKRILVLLDTSASMRRAGLWDEAKARVATVLNRATPVDQVSILTFDRQTNTIVPFEDWTRAAPTDRVPMALGRLGGVTPGWSGTHLGNALIAAAEALAENEAKGVSGATKPLVHEGPRQVVLISDLQAGSRLDALQAYEWPKGVELSVEPIKSRNPTNAGLQIVTDSTDSTRALDSVRVRVTNSGDAKREQFKVGWARAAASGAEGAGEIVGASVDAYVPPGQSRVIAVPVLKDASGVEQLVLRGDDDDFDNVVHAIPPIQQRAGVLWLGSEDPADAKQPFFFLKRAFFDTPRLAVKVTALNPSGLIPPDAFKTANLIFVSESVSPATAAALREEALAGKIVVFVPKTAESGATLGALLGREVAPLREMRPASYAMLGEIDFRHPLFAPFADPRYSDFSKIQIWHYRKMDVAGIPDARVIMKLDSGDPAIVDVPTGKGRIYLMATGWSREDSQLGVSSKLVQLLALLLEQGGGVAQGPAQFFIGDKVPLPPEHGASTVRVPGGATEAVTADAVDFTATQRPGIYELAATAGGRPVRFAVNLDASESRTVPLSVDELEELGLPLAKAKGEAPAPKESKSLLQGSEAENRQKLWRWFIAATLAVLLFESALAGWTARRTAPIVSEAAS